MHRNVIVCAALTLASCGPQLEPADVSPLPDTNSESNPADTSGPVTCDNLAETLLLVGPARGELSRDYGVPDSARTATAPNRHNVTAVDSLFGVYYPGLIVSLRKPKGGRELAEYVRITDNRYIRYPQIGIGSFEADLIAALGPPTNRAITHVEYSCGNDVEQPVTFYIDDGTVREIVIAYYVD